MGEVLHLPEVPRWAVALHWEVVRHSAEDRRLQEDRLTAADLRWEAVRHSAVDLGSVAAQR